MTVNERTILQEGIDMALNVESHQTLALASNESVIPSYSLLESTENVITPEKINSKRERSSNPEKFLNIKPQYRIDQCNLKRPKLETDARNTRPLRGKGQNKSKTRTTRSDAVRLCGSVSHGLVCPYPACKDSHELESFLESKGDDLPGMCPLFAVYGTCKLGFKCRFLSSHCVDGKLVNAEFVIPESQFVKNAVDSAFKKQIKSRVLSERAKEYLKWWEIVGKDETVDEFTKNMRKEKLIESQKKEQVLAGVAQPLEADGIVLCVQEPIEAATEIEHTKPLAALEKLESLATEHGPIALRKYERKQLDFRNKTYLAPLTTVGNLPFRRICKSYGVDITCGEMAMTDSLLKGQPQEWALMKKHKTEDFFGIQVTGGLASPFAEMCDLVRENLEIDFLDINLGCPLDPVCNRGMGSALMTRRNRLRGIVLGAIHTLDVPVTVKLRTGLTEKKIAHNLIPVLQEWGVSCLTLHGRSKNQRYTKLADWDYINQCCDLTDPTKMAFFGNGDIMSPEEHFEHMAKTPNLAGTMIGRGALVKPWIFTELKERKLWDISSNERFGILQDFGKFGMEHWGSDTQGLNMTRRFMCEWLSFLYRYVPVGVIETLPQRMNLRPDRFVGRDPLETLMASANSQDWVKLSEMVLGKAEDGWKFVPKHKSSSYEPIAGE